MSIPISVNGEFRECCSPNPSKFRPMWVYVSRGLWRVASWGKAWGIPNKSLDISDDDIMHHWYCSAPEVCADYGLPESSYELVPVYLVKCERIVLGDVKGNRPCKSYVHHSCWCCGESFEEKWIWKMLNHLLTLWLDVTVRSLLRNVVGNLSYFVICKPTLQVGRLEFAAATHYTIKSP
jgi:hypothetical protein